VLVCSEVTELTTDYLERTLPLPRRLAMKLHLAICSFCRRHLRQVRQTVGLLHRVPAAGTPMVTEDKVMTLLDSNGAGGAVPPGD
jgi:predicted anti-sigma-YlaC factor YlaD